MERYGRTARRVDCRRGIIKMKRDFKRKLVTATTALGILLGAGSIAYANSAYQLTNEQAPTTDLKISGGVIRLDPTEGVYLHTNETHHSVGIESVGIDNETGYLSIRRYKGDAIVSVMASPDETLAGKGITFGPSGGGRTTLIKNV